ncbi:MAG: hypothetical protein FIA97_10975 [Methylococcaceae bacterium]|nr:hypothetical protein [Methylococcaceae bacterium]
MTTTILKSILLGGFSLAAFGAGAVQIDANEQPLGKILESVSQQAGAEIVLADGLADDLITAHVSERFWDEAIHSLLIRYNYETVTGAGGALRRVIVSGRNGDAPAAATPDLLRYQPLPPQIPQKFSSLNLGSALPVEIQREQLLAMNTGERISLSLPRGNYEVIHDNRLKHENGDISWVGYLETAGKAYRVIITMGPNGNLGQAVTPDGVYNLEQEDGKTWLVDLNASGLQLSALENDDVAPSESDGQTTMANAKANRKTQKGGHKGTATTAAPVSAASASEAQPVVDLLVLYTAGVKATPSFATRINHLIAKANQAYIDSNINLKLRLVHAEPVRYTETGSNDRALSDLTLGRSTFSKVSALRNHYGADLVTLLRPFKYQSQLSCGVAWVNGAAGSTMKAGLGYSVVSDGIDAASGSYCSDFTLAHELGHNMGSAHDAIHSNVQGKFPFSYGFGANGKFGTIMSYYNPAIGFFSSPSLTYNGQALGNSNADNATSINRTAATVAGFLPSKVK